MLWIIGSTVAGTAVLVLLLVLMLISALPRETAQNNGDPGGKPNPPVNPNGQKPPDIIPIGQPGPVGKVDPLAGQADPFANLKPPEGQPWLVLNPGGHVATVKRTIFTPDSKRLITVSQDHTVRVWSVATGQTERVFYLPVGKGLEGTLYSGAVSRDGKQLAVGGIPVTVPDGKKDFPIYILSLEAGQVEKVLRGQNGNIVQLEFSPDGKSLYAGSMDTTCCRYDLGTGKIDREFQNKGVVASSVRAIALTPEGDVLAITYYKGPGRLYDTATGQPLAVLSAAPDDLFSVASSGDGQKFATGTFNGSMQLWSRTGQLLQNVKVKPNDPLTISSLSFNKDGTEILWGGLLTKGEVGIFNLPTGQTRLDFPKHNNSVLNVAYSPDGLLAASTGGNDSDTFIWRPQDGKIVHSLTGAGKGVWNVGWTNDGKVVAFGHSNVWKNDPSNMPLQRFFDLESFKFAALPQVAKLLIRQTASADGFTLKAADQFRVDVSRNGKKLGSIKSAKNGDRVYSYTLLGADKAVLGASFGMYVFDLKSGKQVHEFVGHSGFITGVCPSPDGRFLLSGSSDQTLCLWALDRTDPLLTFFFAGDDWVAWSPHGYYACSANGERLIGWQINNGIDQLGSFFEAVRFRQSLYRPDVIRQIIKTGDLRQALAQADKKQDQPNQPLDVGKVLPPQVRILTPAPAAGEVRITQGNLAVTAAAKSTGQHPVKAMRLIVDGRPFSGSDGVVTFTDPKLGVRSATWNVALTPGKHVIAVQAESGVSKAMSDLLHVWHDGVGQQLPNMYVLAVGINDYPGDMKLSFATNDAIELASVFQTYSKGLYGTIDVDLLTDQKATRQGILDGLQRMHTKMKPQDVGIFFFGGHGLQDPWGNFHLVPVDINPNKPRETCLSGETVKITMGNMPGKVVCIFDACHSGKAATMDDLVRDLVTEDYGIIVMCSSLGSEYSLESSVIKHGVFTLGLITGLKGAADIDHDQVVYVHEVDIFTNTFVKQLTKGVQNPITARPPSIPSFALTKKQ